MRAIYVYNLSQIYSNFFLFYVILSSIEPNMYIIYYVYYIIICKY